MGEDSTTAMYGGAELPPISRFVFDRPDGWVMSDLGSPLVTLRPEPQSPTSLTMSVSRVEPGFDLNTLIQSTRADLRRLDPNADIRVQRIGRMNGQVAMLRIAEFSPPTPPDGASADPARGATDTSTMVSIHVAFFGPAHESSASVELFQLAGVTPNDRDDHAQTIMSTINSFRFLGVPSEFVVGATDAPIGASQ